MKRLFCTMALLTAFALPAQAQDLDLKPYVGIDLLRMGINYNSDYDAGSGVILDGDSLLEDSLWGLGVHVGTRFDKYFGAELGYFRTRSEDKSIDAGASVGPGVVAAAPFKTSVKVQGVTLDGLGYLPLTGDGRLELIGTAGISWMKADAKLTVPGVGSGSDDKSEIGFRAGGGAQFAVTDAVSVRGLVRYQSADFDDIADNAWNYTLGVNYSF